MRTRRLLVATLVVAFGLTGVPMATAAPPVLAGTTVVTGASVGAVRVRLPKPVTISLRTARDLGQGEHATFTGAGRLLALALVRSGDETWFTRSNVCMTRGCSGPHARYFGVRWNDEGIETDETTLPAGNYTLHWIADGKGAGVTLRLPGLSGRTTVRPPAQRAAVWGPPAMQDTVEPVTGTGVRTYEGTTEGQFPKGALLVSVQWVVSQRMDARASLCVHPEGETQPPVGCVTRDGSGFESHSFVTCLCLTAEDTMSFGTLSFTRLQPGKYVFDSKAHYIGHFGHTGFAIAAAPLL